MTQQEPSPRALAVAGGVLYLIIIAIGLFGEAGVRGTVIVPGDAVATAANVRSMESLWRFGVAAEYVLLICGTSLAVIFYVLLKPISRTFALLATFFNLVSLAVEAATSLHLLWALSPLKSADYAKAFAPEQLAVLTSLSIKSHASGFGIALIFFGCFCIFAGVLILKSGYIPKAIGALMQLAGVCYLVNSFAFILAPAIANQLFPLILIPAFVGELSLALWLLVKGGR